ncbi:MAG: hypothetical protein ACRDGS_13260, partial [Chloroflexota bacterium]
MISGYITRLGRLAKRRRRQRIMQGDTVVDRPVLEVYIVPHCFGCERARYLAAEIQVRFPGVTVQ